MSPIVRILLVVFFPISYPISKVFLNGSSIIICYAFHLLNLLLFNILIAF